MPPELQQSSPDHSAELAQSRRSVKEWTRGRLQKHRQQRIAMVPPNLGEYMLVGVVGFSNDILDYATGSLGVTGVWLVVLRILDLATAAALLTWAFARGVKKFGGSKEKAQRLFGAGVLKHMQKWLLALVVEFIPFIGEITPMWTITVLLAYRDHRRAYAKAETSRQAEAQEMLRAQNSSYQQARFAAAHAETAREAA